ncbi:hypothetical protein CROQUDRAFT_284175 [Cronartium quercuum f. sp. fusiforme G11]|uniref:Uncharacterized protein n=1 Tax=Cronartium quercuum f. sp. fusiforme G11 TaxID=708437 RepID=A0A9P6T8I7_9BASI|nr:hypothetical protein CROQUDRAFT_284175 [Cronartium quercuum f. sp. fusiforme G11]
MSKPSQPLITSKDVLSSASILVASPSRSSTRLRLLARQDLGMVPTSLDSRRCLVRESNPSRSSSCRRSNGSHAPQRKRLCGRCSSAQVTSDSSSQKSSELGSEGK